MIVINSKSLLQLRNLAMQQGKKTILESLEIEVRFHSQRAGLTRKNVFNFLKVIN